MIIYISYIYIQYVRSQSSWLIPVQNQLIPAGQGCSDVIMFHRFQFWIHLYIGKFKSVGIKTNS